MPIKIDTTPRQIVDQGHDCERGSGSMRVVSIALVAALFLILSGCERWALDKQMEELCKKDGGVKVYETVTLPARYFTASGSLILGPSMAQGLDTDFQRVGEDDYRILIQRAYLVGTRTTKLDSGSGVLTRTKVSVVRWRDKFLMGEQISYARSGGDGVTFGLQPSGKSCPFLTYDLAQSIFMIGN